MLTQNLTDPRLGPRGLALLEGILRRGMEAGHFRQLDTRREQVLVEARGRLTLDEADIARAAVLDGSGIGFFIEQDVMSDIASGRLIRLLEDWTPPRPGFSLYYPGRRNPSAGFAAFLAMVREGMTRR